MARLIQKLEDETERAHENTRKLHRNLRVTTLNEERTSRGDGIFSHKQIAF